MLKKLKKTSRELFRFSGGKKIIGPNNDMWGDSSGLWGDCSGLWGDCSGLRGNCTGLLGNCSGVWGDLGDCEISDEDRVKGININDLIT